jgi:acetyltransferase-like isoleucine patch superfamily enzyme
MPGLIIAEGSVIGAGAILTKSTEPWTIYVGNPARPIKKRNNKKILEFARFIEMDT